MSNLNEIKVNQIKLVKLISIMNNLSSKETRNWTYMEGIYKKYSFIHFI